MEFINLNRQYKRLEIPINRAIAGVLERGQFILGSEVSELEEALAEYVGVRHAVACGSGTDALQLIFMALGVGKGDAVFCPDVSFIASVEPACMLGAEAVFCDIDPHSINLCAVALEEAVQRTIQEGRLVPKAVVAVDFLGNPANYSELETVAERYGMKLIEDAAQSMGGSLGGKRCGSFGIAAATSFFPTKPLGCYGDGGCVLTNDAALADTVRCLRAHGKGQSKYSSVAIGMNSRLDTVQAAVLLRKLEVLQDEMTRRAAIAKTYDDAFRDVLQIPRIAPNSSSAYAQYALLAPSKEVRDSIMKELQAADIPTMVYYPVPLSKQPVFAGKTGSAANPNAEDYCNRTFSLPFSPYLESEEQRAVVQAVLRALGPHL